MHWVAPSAATCELCRLSAMATQARRLLVISVAVSCGVGPASQPRFEVVLDSFPSLGGRPGCDAELCKPRFGEYSIAQCAAGYSVDLYGALCCCAGCAVVWALCVVGVTSRCLKLS